MQLENENILLFDFFQLIGYIMKIVGNVSTFVESLLNVHNLHNLCKNLHCC